MTRLARAARSVSAATLVSRVLGLLRDAVRSALVGARELSDALDVAFKVPNLLRDLFAEGAFSGAFVPTLSRTREREGDAAAFALLNRVLSTMVVYVGLVVVALVTFAPEIVTVLTSPAFTQGETFALTVTLVRILAPFLLLICLAVAAMGALNVMGRYFVPALSPATQNAVLVLGGVVLLEIVRGRAAAAVPWALLLLGGGLAQFVVQVPALLRAGWRPRFLPDLSLQAPETRQILRRMLPVAAGLAATQASILINTRLATAHPGGTSNLYYAFRLVHLPVGLVGVAVGTVVLAEASRAAGRGDRETIRRTFAEGLVLTFALAAPSAVGLAVLGEPIARLLYFWPGRTHPGEALAIGTTIRYFAPAVVFYCSVKVVVPVFYAQGRVRVPVIASFVAVGANLACALALHPYLQWRGLALAVGCGQAANLAVLLWIARDLFGPPDRAALAGIGKILVATALSGAAAAATAAALPHGDPWGWRLARGIAPVLAGAGAYFLAGRVLRSREILAIIRLHRLDRSD